MFYLSDGVNGTELTNEEYTELRQHLEWMRKREDDLEYIRAVREVVANNRGCTTPTEDFIERLLLAYLSTGGGLTPEDAERNLQEFREAFENMVETTHYLLGKYPEILKAELRQA